MRRIDKLCIKLCDFVLPEGGSELDLEKRDALQASKSKKPLLINLKTVLKTDRGDQKPYI